MPAKTISSLGPEEGWIMKSNIDWREGVSVRTLGPKGGREDCEILHRLERGMSVSMGEGRIVRSHIDWRRE